ncbi:MAG TPA: sigma-70 family RNA polymerase sigma factor [Kofleriaceae bacterium]|nr:sigma-70 family RNA polymerase sigma factor [Kofleriaceae bacterium]
MAETAPDHLLTAAQAGDPAALNRIVADHRQGVYRYGLHVCRTTEDAEDAVQETLWTATRAIRTFRGTASSIASWLFTIVRRECLRLLERHKRAPVSLDDDDRDVMAEVVDPGDALALKRRIDLLAGALADLDPLHREVILLRDIQELSAPEAATQLGISIDALKSRLHRARVNLREHVLRRSEAPGR